jgi:uncharacterized protein YqjF (DUF2071 family)
MTEYKEVRHAMSVTIPERGPIARPLRPLFVADWTDALFVHYAVDPTALRPLVPQPLELDLRDGKAFISLVAFTQRRLRPRFGGRLTAFLSRPLAEHHFLNVRTYVRHAGEAGIHFLAEWIPNPLACLLGPPLYGLPYRLGTLDIRRGEERVDVLVNSKTRELRFTGEISLAQKPRPAEPDTLDEFLVERYTAFTIRGDALYCFRIEHAPWPLRPATVEVEQTSLLKDLGLSFSSPPASHWSAGIHNVQISAPQRL